ncbi:MAG: helix-turn-helix domain-containing protein, partial [Bacteroidales bacterium]|nr:helix-turn-helix domain-containing protein [Bacteroidales bacterium]
MKTFSVKQIAEMLGTNPETVRRWIRENKMSAIQTSRKNGNIVTESELER